MLAACRGAAEAASVDYPRLVYPYIEKEVKLATLLPVQRLCALAAVSRAGFYRWRHAPPAVDADLICVMPSSTSRWSGPAMVRAE